MSRYREVVKNNSVNSPVLFVGCGGRGSDIVKGVADRALHDDNSKLRFVTFDTDVNDILRIDKSANVIAIQTSTTASVGQYLKRDKEAKEEWFPLNKMVEKKSMSEGAGHD